MILEDSLIVALDFPNLDKASKLVVSLGGAVSFYKVGMELFYGAGAEAINYLKNYRKKIFLDLKLHDIPNTVAQSVEILSALGVNMINLHAAGGQVMMREAEKAARRSEDKTGKKAPALLAVTVLTSLNQAQWEQVHGPLPLSRQAVKLAMLARESGMDGVISSPAEAAAVRAACGLDFLIVTPGIRRLDDSRNDQNRTATPRAALESGASHIVVGRPITAAAEPKEAARLILQDMREVNA
jgi:orotidine-5'-phosphate decarboxylase